MYLIKKIDQFVEQHQLIGQDQTIIIGFSGGPDSLFLLHYLVKLRPILHLSLVAAHLDHEWRATSAKDEEFCKKVCAELNVPFESSKISNLAYKIKPTGSKEQDARKARRYFFESIAQKYNAQAIALAQHQDDQEETFFIRLLRGATVTGLACMWPKHGKYIRPLLSINKAEILEWLHLNKLTYAIDETNEQLDYLRNRIRHELLPVAKKIDDRSDINCLKTIGHLQQTEFFLQKLTAERFSTIAQFDATLASYLINLEQFFAQEQFMQHRLLIHWFTLERLPLPASHSFLKEVIRFLMQTESKSHAMHQAWFLVKQKKHCYVKRTVTQFDTI